MSVAADSELRLWLWSHGSFPWFLTGRSGHFAKNVFSFNLLNASRQKSFTCHQNDKREAKKQKHLKLISVLVECFHEFCRVRCCYLTDWTEISIELATELALYFLLLRAYSKWWIAHRFCQIGTRQLKTYTDIGRKRSLIS